jgi:hypothetical protein
MFQVRYSGMNALLMKMLGAFGIAPSLWANRYKFTGGNPNLKALRTVRPPKALPLLWILTETQRHGVPRPRSLSNRK